MSRYDEEYYVALPIKKKGYVELAPDERSAEREIGLEELVLGKPLFFENEDREEFERDGITERITAVMFAYNAFVVETWIKEEIAQYQVEGLQLYPAVVVDMDGNYHEDYWFLNFYEQKNYWDRARSTLASYDEDDEDEEDDDYDPEWDDDIEVERFVLDERKLSAVPEEKRLMFMPEGAGMPYVFLHERIAEIFWRKKVDGIRLVKVADFVASEDT